MRAIYQLHVSITAENEVIIRVDLCGPTYSAYLLSLLFTYTYSLT